MRNSEWMVKVIVSFSGIVYCPLILTNFFFSFLTFQPKDPGVATKATHQPPPPGMTMTHTPGDHGGTTPTIKWVTRPPRPRRATVVTFEATEQVTTWTLATYSAPPPHLRLVSAPSPPLRTAPCTEVRCLATPASLASSLHYAPLTLLSLLVNVLCLEVLHSVWKRHIVIFPWSEFCLAAG